MRRMVKAAASAGMATFLLLLLACGSTSTPKTPDALELFNHRLSPTYAQWMVGAAYRMASPEEIQRFLDLQNDEQAEAFIKDFWEKRPGRMPGTLQTYRSAFESRSEEADRLFSESGRAGRHSDRGTIYVLFGEPDDSSFVDASMNDSRTVELWTYAKDAKAGLDGNSPETSYRFIDQGGLTVFYRGTVGLRPRRPRL